jgi:type IV pilus assembly protein PilA
MTAAKAAEAIQSVGHISRSAHASFERELMAAQNVAEGAESMQAAHLLCESAQPVPGFVPAGKKYQPTTGTNQDFDTGSDSVGWRCLRFRIYHPIYHQHMYTKGSSPAAPNNTAKCAGPCYEAACRGDLNNNGTYSVFARTGFINTATGRLKEATVVYIEMEAE